MIKLDTRSNETLEFQIGLSGVRNPSTVEYRLIMMITDGLSFSFKGLYSDGELVFNLPKLPVLDKQEVPFFIEMVVEDYYQIIYESSLEIVNPPKAEILKMTHVKEEVKEDKKPIQIKEKIEIKPSKFRKGFEIFVKERKNKNDR